MRVFLDFLCMRHLFILVCKTLSCSVAFHETTICQCQIFYHYHERQKHVFFIFSLERVLLS